MMRVVAWARGLDSAYEPTMADLAILPMLT